MINRRFDDWARLLAGHDATRRATLRLLAGETLDDLFGVVGRAEAATPAALAGMRCKARVRGPYCVEL